MKIHLTALSITLVLAALPQSLFGQANKGKGTERIGVYDSRAVAVAYVGSGFQQQKMKELSRQFEQAKAAGNASEISRLEAEGQAWQARLNRQGFGTAPVEDILGHIAGDLPKIQEAAGVTNLVSKWNTAELKQHPKAKQVDLTMQLVDAFHPNATQRKRALEIQQKSPEKKFMQ